MGDGVNLQEAFTKLLNNSGQEEFTTILSELQSSRQALTEFLQEFVNLENEKIEPLWSALETICTDTILNCCADCDDSQDAIEKFDRGCAVLYGIATVGYYTLEDFPGKVPQSLTETVVILNGVLIKLPPNQFKLKNAIANVCEMWWTKDIPDKNRLYINLLIYSLERATMDKCLKNDIKRIWILRYGFKLISFENETGRQLKDLFVNCIASRPFLDCSEGMKCLSLILCLHEEFMIILHRTVKKHLPLCTRKQAHTYGQIYHKTWTCISGNRRERFENDCIQDFMFHAIHAKANPYSPFANLKEFLTAFHIHRQQRDVGQMLFKLYEPILWRSFKVPNATIRANAAAVLFDAFPLEDYELPLDENEEWQQKQFAIIKDLLRDPVPNIRCTAAYGVCVICDRYWSIIPNDVIHSWIITLIDDLRLDASSVNVRENVFKGLIQLLNNPLSHQFLKTVLPKLRNSFHDTSESVRVAVVELLIKLKSLSSIEYWSVVPVEHLFARLAVDTPPVARRIVKLLKNSFYPKSQDKTFALNRAVYFIKTHRPASRKFYRYVHEFMDLKESVSFLLQISPCLMSFATSKFESYKEQLQSANLDDSENVDPNKEDDSEESSCLEDPNILTGLLDIIGIIWAGIHSELQKTKNSKLEKKLQEAYKDTLETFSRCCKSDCYWDSLLYLTSFLPPNQVVFIRSHCLKRIRSLSEDADANIYGTYLVNLCRWDCVEELCDILSQWLAAAMTTQRTPAANRKRSRKGVRFIEPYEDQPSLACDILCWMLTDPYCQEALLYNRPPVLMCWQQLKISMQLIEHHMKGQSLNKFIDDAFLEKAFTTYCRITVVLQKEPLHESAKFMGEVLAWSTECLIPKLIKSDEEERTVHLCEKLIRSLLLMLSDMALVSLLTRPFVQEILEFSKCILVTEIGINFLEYICRLVYQLIEYCLTRKDKKEMSKELTVSIPDLINCLIEPIAMKSRAGELKNIPDIPKLVKCYIIEIMETYSKYKALTHVSFKDILSTFVVAVIADLGADLTRIGAYPAYQNITEAPILTRFFISIFSTKMWLLRVLVGEINECILLGELTQFPGPLLVAAFLHLLSRERKCLKVTGMKTAIESARNLLNEANKRIADTSEQESENVNETDSFICDKEMAKITAELLDGVSSLLSGDLNNNEESSN